MNTQKNTSTLNRRRFITSTAATAATFTIVKPHLARGSEVNSKIQVGCVGLGRRGNLIAKLIRKHGGYNISAIADYFPHVAEKAAKKHGVDAKRTFSGLSGYQQLIDSKVDAVVLETPPYCFPDHATAAVNAGCHVYMAKPVAIDTPGCLQIGKMGKKATENKQVFLVDFQMRVDPYLTECIKRLRDGAIGKIGFIRSFYDDNGFSDPPLTDNWESRLRHLIWVNDLELGGGKLVNAGIHAVDAALWIAGENPISCTGSSARVRIPAHGDSHDVYSLTYKFPSGLILNYSGQQYPNKRRGGMGCKVYGKNAFMETNYAGKSWVYAGRKSYKGGSDVKLYRNGIVTNLKTFHRSIIDGVYDNPTVKPSVDSNLATILGREAGRSNGVVTWNQMIKNNNKIEVDLSSLKP